MFKTDHALRQRRGFRLSLGATCTIVVLVMAGMIWAGGGERRISDDDRAWWAFQPVTRAQPPAVKQREWGRNPIDAFVLAKLESVGLTPAEEADRLTLIRRATFDLHGLPPTPEQIDAFLNDPSADAYEKLIDRLLASPRYGERWARYWLDLVRYADSDGYRADAFRPHAWRYRDYVVRSFNADKPYDQFVMEQLAGDEIAPNDPEVLTATGYLRQWIYEWNQRDARTQWTTIINDVTDVTGDVFLGLSMACARCHDHKFDPILQKDYYALQAFFAPMLPRDDVVAATPEQKQAYQRELEIWENKTAALRKQIEEIEAPVMKAAEKGAIDRFPADVQALSRKPDSDRTPHEQQIYWLVHNQVLFDQARSDRRIKGETREQWSKLKQELTEFDDLKPKPLPAVMAVTDVGPKAPPVSIPGDRTGRTIAPGFLTVLGEPAPTITPTATSTGRRTALARWLTRPDHPLTSRVMVNRIWQHHFGTGIVATSSDFGRLGEKPSHPKLLDWLAAEFVDSGWSIKHMHRLIMNSAAYRQTATRPMPEIARKVDPGNRLLWRRTPRRLDAGQLRDAMLAVSGELRFTGGGRPSDASRPVRTIYTKMMRNSPDPLLEAFDLVDGVASVPCRNITTTAPQALMLMNSERAVKRAEALARRVMKATDQRDARIRRAYRLALGRLPGQAELKAARTFIEQGNRQAELALGEPVPRQVLPHRGQQALAIRDGQKLMLPRLPDTPELPSESFTVEAFIQLETLYPDASVRVIASQWQGHNKDAGWSFGITSEKSRYSPRNLIVQLVGPTADGKQHYEVIASDLRPELHKPYYVAAVVRTGPEPSATFYMQDLSDAGLPLQTVTVKHPITGQHDSAGSLVIGGRDRTTNHRWDGLIDEVRLTGAALSDTQLLIHDGASDANIVGYWKFEDGDHPLRDSSARVHDLVRSATDGGVAPPAGLADFCHAILNTNEFLYVD